MKKCKLTLKDEVNCKFEGLDPNTRMEMVKAVRQFLPYARNIPSVRLGRWNGAVDFMNMGGDTYFHLLDKLIPVLEKNHYEIELIDQRINHQFEFEEIDKNFFNYVKFGAGHHMEGKSIILHDHQVNAVNACLKNEHGTLLASTSSGKTLITAALSKKVEKYGRSIVIVPNKDLVQQTFNDYSMLGLDAGVFYGDKKELNCTHTITTWQSLHSLWKKTKKGDIELTEQDVHDFIDGVVCVIVDELHTAAGEALSSVLLEVMRNIPIRWGLTGTIPKDEILKSKIKCNVGEIIYTISAKELQDKGILSTCNVNCFKLKSTLKFESYQEELKYLVTNTERMKYISELIEAIAQSGNTLVLVDRLEAGEEICKALNIPLSEFVRGATKKKDREASYGEIRWADNKILIATYGVASTGISISRLYNVVLLEPGKSFVRTIQSIGRGLRKAEDKDHVEIYDISGTNKYSAKHLRERIQYYKEVQYPYEIVEIKDWGEK